MPGTPGVYVFEDRENAGYWRVERIDDDDGCEVVEIFKGPNARQKARQYAEQRYGKFEEIKLEPYSPAVLRHIREMTKG
jgi:hypothetical protein